VTKCPHRRNPAWDNVEGGENAHEEVGHCFYDPRDGTLLPWSWRAWERQQGACGERGERVGMLLDLSTLDQGSTMIVDKNVASGGWP
jgi:hypothetical protein